MFLIVSVKIEIIPEIQHNFQLISLFKTAEMMCKDLYFILN